MKLTCTEPGCGAVIQAAAESDPGLLARLMSEHVRTAHAPAVERQLLTESRAMLSLIAHGENVHGSEDRLNAAELHNRISELLGLPALDLQDFKPLVVENLEQEKQDAGISD